MAATTLKASADAWVDEAVPQQGHGQAAKLRFNNTGGSMRLAFVFFARPFPFGATILSAKLRLYLAGGWGGSQVIVAKRVVDKWKEGRVKWARQPNYSDTHYATATVSGGADGDLVEIDVTSMLGDVSATADWHGFRLNIDNSAARALYSSEHPKARLRPQLEIEWVVNPDEPVNLLPSGGLAVSPAKPILSWQFAEKFLKDETGQSASQVQVSSSTDFSSPLYNSGKQANTLSHWDLDAAGASAISDGDTVYWRVRAWDEADQVSEWSATASFQRCSHGTLTLDNPAADPDNFVDETTPPIAWTFSGRTQEAWALRLFRVASNGNLHEIHHEPREASDDDDFTLPPGLLKSHQTYAVRLTVWDTIDRISIHGDPGHVQVERQFTYQREGSPVPVTDLVATPDGARMVLSFERATMPDYFALRVDDVEVADRLDPMDFFTGGTSYSLDYWGALPRERQQYEVEAVVIDAGKHKHSADNDVVHAKTNPSGIWLVDPADSVFVRLTGPDDDASLEIREVGTTYDVLGARHPVRITDAIMGYAGTIAGHVGSKAERDDFLELKGRLAPLRLIVSDLNILVYLEATTPSPTFAPADQLYRIEAELFQVDESFEIAGGSL